MIETFFIEQEKYPRAAQDTIDHLRAWEQNFRVIRTSRSICVHYLDTKYYYVERKISQRALAMINALRKQVAERMQDVELKRREDVRYYSWKKAKVGEQLYEYDLTAAYAHSLHELKLCTDDLYFRLLDLQKPDRLAVVGALATKKFVDEYESGQIVSSSIETQPTEPAWWTICYHVDRIMLDYMQSHEESVGYWVDAFFSRKQVPFSHPHKHRVVSVVEADNFLILDDGRRFTMSA